MPSAVKDKALSGLRALRPLVTVILLVPLLAGCAGSSDAPRSLSFDAGSDKAIVIVGTSVTRAQEEVRSGRSLETYWQQYDPQAQLLLPGGESIVTIVDGGIFSEPGYLKPTVSVLEVDPGAYALIGAGFPNFMTLFVRSNDPLSRYKSDNPGQIQSWTYTVDPRRHINPEAPVDSKENILFSVAPGQIVYIGHFRFWKLPFSDKFASIGYSQDVADVAAAREALKDFPGIAGDMTVQDLRLPVETAAR